jgi:hypothetical protein
MKRNHLIKHKEAIIVCEESEPISMSCNALLTTLDANAGVKHVVHVVIAKSTLTCTNCGKVGHLVESYHKRKKKVLVVPTATVTSTRHVARTKTQLVKLREILVHYPCIICSSVEHRLGKCLKKIEE